MALTARVNEWAIVKAGLNAWEKDNNGVHRVSEFLKIKSDKLVNTNK